MELALEKPRNRSASATYCHCCASLLPNVDDFKPGNSHLDETPCGESDSKSLYFADVGVDQEFCRLNLAEPFGHSCHYFRIGSRPYRFYSQSLLLETDCNHSPGFCQPSSLGSGLAK